MNYVLSIEIQIDCDAPINIKIIMNHSFMHINTQIRGGASTLYFACNAFQGAHNFILVSMIFFWVIVILADHFKNKTRQNHANKYCVENYNINSQQISQSIL